MSEPRWVGRRIVLVLAAGGSFLRVAILRVPDSSHRTGSEFGMIQGRVDRSSLCRRGGRLLVMSQYSSNRNYRGESLE